MKKIVLGIFGLIAGAALVWVLFHNTDWGMVWQSIRDANYALMTLGLLACALSHLTRVRRWSFIVRAVHPASFRELFSATQIGFLANFTLPGRAGEVIRALVLTRLTKVPFTQSFAFVAVDRLLDLFSLIIVMGVAILAFQPLDMVSIPAATFGTSNPITFSAEQYRTGAMGIGVVVLVVILGYGVLYTNRGIFLRISSVLIGLVSKRAADYVNGMINHFADGLHIFRSPMDMVRAFMWSMATWLLNLLGLAFALSAMHIDYPWYTPVVMQAILSVFIAAPNTPGFVGQFHVPIVLTLVMVLPDIDVDTAKAYAIIAHLMQLPPIAAFGVWSLARERMGLLQLQSESAHLSESEPDNH